MDPESCQISKNPFILHSPRYINLGEICSVYADGSVKLYLQKYVSETFQSFLKEEPEAEIGWSTFAKFKPHNVKLAGEPNEPISL